MDLKKLSRSSAFHALRFALILGFLLLFIIPSTVTIIGAQSDQKQTVITLESFPLAADTIGETQTASHSTELHRVSNYSTYPKAEVAKNTENGPGMLNLVNGTDGNVTVAVSVINANQINLAWKDTTAGNKTTYRVERAYEGNFTQFTVFVLLPKTLTFNDTTTEPRTVYYYRVLAIGPNGNSTASNVERITTPDVVPVPPDKFKAIIVSDKEIDLTWIDRADNESQYIIKKTNGQNETIDFTCPIGSESYNDTSIIPSNNYYYRIFARNSVGDSLPASIGPIIIPEAPNFFSQFIIPGIVGLVSFLVAGAGTFLFLRRNSLTVPDNSFYLQRDLQETKAQRDDLRRKLQSFQTKNEQESGRLPGLKDRYSKLSNTLQKLKTPLSEIITNQVDSQWPVEQYDAYVERIRVIQAINDYILLNSEKEELLKRECLQLALELKIAEPALFGTLEKAIATSHIDGLTVLKPLLVQMKQQEQKSEVSPQVKSELASLEKSIEGIRDYSYRLIPSRLIKFANNLIEQPASEKENAMRERTVQEIIKLINEYLKI